MHMEPLNHHNPELVTWKYEEILFALLGGIRIEGLHSMRVTLKVDFKTFPSILLMAQRCGAYTTSAGTPLTY